MNAPPPADKAPPADAVSKGYEEKAAKARGSKKINDKLEAVGRIGEASCAAPISYTIQQNQCFLGMARN